MAGNVRRLGWIGIGAAWIGAVQACSDPSEERNDNRAESSTGGTPSSSGGAGGTPSNGGAVTHAGGAEGTGGAGSGSGGDGGDAGLAPDSGGDGGPRDADASTPGRVRLLLKNESGRPVIIQSRLPCGLMPGWFAVRVGDVPFHIAGLCGPLEAGCAPLEYSQLQPGVSVSYDWTVPQVLPQDWGEYRCPGAAPPDGTLVTVRFCWGPSDWNGYDAVDPDTPDEAPAGTDCVDRTFTYGGDQTIEHVIEPPAEAGSDASEGDREAGGG